MQAIGCVRLDIVHPGQEGPVGVSDTVIGQPFVETPREVARVGLAPDEAEPTAARQHLFIQFEVLGQPRQLVA